MSATPSRYTPEEMEQMEAQHYANIGHLRAEIVGHTAASRAKVRIMRDHLRTLRDEEGDVELEGSEGAAVETMLAEIETRLVAASAIMRGLPQ